MIIVVNYITVLNDREFCQSMLMGTLQKNDHGFYYTYISLLSYLICYFFAIKFFRWNIELSCFRP